MIELGQGRGFDAGAARNDGQHIARLDHILPHARNLDDLADLQFVGRFEIIRVDQRADRHILLA